MVYAVNAFDKCRLRFARKLIKHDHADCRRRLHVQELELVCLQCAWSLIPDLMCMYIVPAPFGVLVSVTCLALLSSLSHSRTFLYRHILNIVFSAIFPSPYLSDMPVLVELRLVWSFQGGFTLSLLAVVRIFYIGFMC